MKKNNIEVSWVFGTDPAMQIDFGLFEAHKKNRITVDKDVWFKYCELRRNFEIAHKDLVEKIKN